jgi:chaperone modulatory protein CbpM
MTEWLTLEEVARYCRVDRRLVVEWVELGVVEPVGAVPAEWRFAATAVEHVAMVARLARELDLTPYAAALVGDLLEERRRLERRVRELERLFGE